MPHDTRKPPPAGVRILPPLRPVDFTISVPGGKSPANRAILLAGVAEGVSTIRGVPDADDVTAAVSALTSLGVVVERAGSGVLRIFGEGPDFSVRSGVLDVGSSGTVGRFLPGLLAASTRGVWRIDASAQLAARPLAPLVRALRQWGADIEQPEAPGSFPLLVRGTGLEGGRVAISAAASSQFASGLLMAAPLASSPAEIVVRDLDSDEPYIDMTVAAIRDFGVTAAVERSAGEERIRVEAPCPYRAADIRIEADYNNALYFLSLPLLRGGRAAVDDLPSDSLQPGRRFLSVISRLGGVVTAEGGRVAVAYGGGVLRGGFEVNMRTMSESVPLLGALAVFADGPVGMTDIARVRNHETDRIAAFAAILERFGVRVETGADWMRVHPLPHGRLVAATIDSRDDHRLAMATALLGAGGDGVTITNSGVVAKSFPDFYERLGDAGVDIRWQ